MIAFLISNNSYHSVERNNIYERKSLQVAIYYKHKDQKNSIYFRDFPLFIGANTNSKSVKSDKFYLKKNKFDFLQLVSSKETFFKKSEIIYK